MNSFLLRFSFLLLGSVLLFGCASSIKTSCSMKSSVKSCQSEMETYQNSMKDNKKNRELPLRIKAMRRGELGLDNADLGENRPMGNNQTWVMPHRDLKGMLIGGHSIYWSFQDEGLVFASNAGEEDRVLSPARLP